MISFIRKGILIIMACVGGVIGGCESKKVPLNKEQFREKLRRERAVELAYEDHRFWDVRRWKIADTTQRELYGVKIEKQADGTFNFYKNLYETRNWRDCMYLYPIPQSELYKNTNLNPQNTGW